MNLKQIQKLFASQVHWDEPKRGIILARTARACFNARRFRDRANVDFAGDYRRVVKPDEPIELCDEKGTYIEKRR